MFKLKPGNVFQKINKMDKKQAYTWGAIIVVCFVSLLTLASFMGDADESSFDGFNTRGYDLAQMPFMNDEAEQYLLASKYPDMQGNNSTMLYSAGEKQARQEEDAAAAAEAAEDFSETGEDSSDYASGGSYGGYSGGYSGGGASSGPTPIGQLDNATVSHASGSGVSTSWGAPRGDFSPYESQEKGTEAPFPQLKNQDARRALAQFAQTSRAAAGLRDSKGANTKRALMGGHVQGSEAFTENGVDLSKSGGLALDTNAPVSSADLSNLDDALSDAAQKSKDDKDDLTSTLEDRLLEQLFSGLLNLGLQAVGDLLGHGIDALQGTIAGNNAYNSSLQDAGMSAASQPLKDSPDSKQLLVQQYGEDAVNKWMEKNQNGLVWQCQADLGGAPQISRIPTEPVQPQRSDYLPKSSSGGADVAVPNDNDIVLGQEAQQKYEEDMRKYNEQKQAYEEYQKADDKGKRKIEEKRVKQELKRQEQQSKNFSKYYARQAEIAKTDDYWAALDRKNAAYSSYTGRSNYTVPDTQNEQEWWASYGKNYGDATVYDQSKVAACKRSPAPLVCLNNAKKQ